MPEIYGDVPKPWLLAYGFTEDDELSAALRRHSTKITFLRNDLSIGDQVRQSDYDALVVVGDVPTAARHLYVLQFGGNKGGKGIDRYGIEWYGPRLNQGVAEKLTGPDEAVPPEASDLARRSLVPFLQETRPRHLLFRMKPEQSLVRTSDDGITAFVREYQGGPCAGYWHRPSGSSWWWLPSAAPDRVGWLDAAFADWRRQDQERFPSGPSWAEEEPWLTAAELEAQRELDEHAERERKSQAELAARRRELEEAREAARLHADAVERRLLTAQGEALVAEVKATLEQIGFEVTDSDRLPANASEKLEDLRASVDHWVALVEVKGYGGRRTAKTSDLLQIGRAATRYAVTEHRAPDAQWYVVNQQAGSNPALRPRPLVSNRADVETFQRDGGLVIDTVDLFRLREAVRRGSVAPEAALELLRKSTGVFTFA
ncbi:hypothetical protein [Micromonospora aurantiaca (nom. illeg.)]|uniref:hypothetical protein n=1 Tax=Micromonospora aurantiaca (nom. illeg.) TaxID=47850 RepID=UPI0008277EC4|nr:hypothetical protein [Micromonospora aurantiaca]SCL41045.1 hypothetical protein GA0070615_4765 [Micromonospora aurantiaca]